MIRKTRLMSKAGLMLVRVEVFDDGMLRSTVFRVSTPTSGQTFTAIAKATAAFRVMSRHPAETPPLRRAA